MSAKILVVDDEPDIVELLELSLELRGWQVISATDGVSALEMAQNEHPDLMILDVMIPKMHGYDLCSRLKADTATKDIPIIILSARGQAKEIAQGFAAQADDYVVKPFDPYELGDRIEKLLNRRRQ